MGKWVQVQCNCRNRIQLDGYPGSSWGPYACGHEDGAILSFPPNDLVEYGDDLNDIYKGKPEIFKIWRRIGDWRNYGDKEYLSISPDEVAIWQSELELLRRFLSGEEYMGKEEAQMWNRLREEERQRYARIEAEPTRPEHVLAQGRALCKASQEMNKPIEFFW